MSTLLRRDLIRLLGLASAGALLPTLGGRRQAHAAPASNPKRILFYYTAHGTLQQRGTAGYKNFWIPDAPGAPTATSLTAPWSTTSHTLGELHAPLVARKAGLTFIHGLDMVSTFDDPTPAGNAHAAGETHAMTGIHRLPNNLAGGLSIDQLIAKGLNSPTPQTLLPSLELTVSESGTDYTGSRSAFYLGAGQPLPELGDPVEAYDRLFPNGPIGTTPAEIAAHQKAIAQQKSVLDFARRHFEAEAARSGPLDRARLAAHAAALDDLKGRLDLGGLACTAPSKSGKLPPPGGSARYTYLLDVMMKLVQAAFACDLTRVVSLTMQQPPPDLVGYTSVAGTTDLHDLIHKTNGASALIDNPAAVQIAKNYHLWHATQFDKLLHLLESIPEPGGGTLLDNTLVVWCGQLGAGNHCLRDLPFILAGKAGGALTQGRYIRYPRTPDSKGGWIVDGTRGLPHNMLLLSLARLMGVNASVFGAPEFCPGPLPGLV